MIGHKSQLGGLLVNLLLDAIVKALPHLVALALDEHVVIVAHRRPIDGVGSPRFHVAVGRRRFIHFAAARPGGRRLEAEVANVCAAL